MSKTKWNLLDEKDQTLGFFDWVIATAPPEQTFVIMSKSFKYYSPTLFHPNEVLFFTYAWF